MPNKKHAKKPSKKEGVHHKRKPKAHAKKKPASHARHEKKEKVHDDEEHGDAIDDMVDEPQTPEESLRYIYELDADNDEDVDMSKLDIIKTPIVRRILLSTLLVLIAIAAGLAGTVILNNPFNDGNQDALTFDINADEEGIVSGQKTEITIPYNNPGNVPLADVEIVLHLPDSFILDRALPDPIEFDPLEWKIGSLDPDENGEIIIEGTFFEKPGSAVTIQTISRFTPANFSSPFEDIVSKSVIIEESIFATAIDGPDRSVPGELQEYKITVEHNNADTPVKNVELRLDLPQGFTIDNSSIESSEENLPIWILPELVDEDVFELTVSGMFSSDTQGEQGIVSRVGVSLHDEFVEQASETFTSTVLASEFALSLIVNGRTGDSIVLPNDDIIVNVSLDNRGEEAADTITIELFVDEGMDRLNLAERAGIPNGDVHGNKINWDHTDMNRLETLHGGDDASIDVAIPTNADGASTIVLRAEATISNVGDLEINRKIESSTITIQVASDVQATANALYYDASGSSVGSGPLPPQVGQETVYRVTWSVANALNDVKDLVMIAPIPSDSSWGGLVSNTDGNVHFDSVANRVRWSVGDLPAGAAPPIAVFDIKVNPSSADVGTFLDLLGAGAVTAYDTVTGAQVTTSAPSLTSELPNDPLAENKGVVIE
ncbi:MAG TPA: hypothetical protein QF873_03720 [Patescibacteria group bacterium]|nr:hypothetical protein [Patescibacteria group bacterium]